MSKISYEEVKKTVEQNFCSLVSTQYKNLKENLEIRCPNGHIFFQNYDYIRKHGCCCPQCNKENLVSKESYSAPKTSKYRILALDQATLLTGWSLWDGKDLIAYGAFKSQEKSSPERIHYLKEWLISMIENNNPDLVLLEDIQLQDYGNGYNGTSTGIITFKVLAKLQGVLEDILIEKSIPYHIVHTATWRAAVGVKGRKRVDKKRSAQLIVKQLYGLTATEDEADAICIGRYGILTYQGSKIIEW